ncbi:olfactory receptor 52A1-like [Rhinatrema bivittatum]|uniref:olfactory receptor 52A1-like n=1 Tax=Rhinatrema bivittatum TaxID=194408 RepID=UPI001129D10F|nr:olfactory receptor 52A1-like [Rhinatrema bivittatum]
MSSLNSSTSYPSTFILIGIPGLETIQDLIAVPFCSMYFFALFGNAVIVTVITSTSSLHEPMFIFLSMLAVTDIFLCTSIVPKMLGIFWFNLNEINVNACLAQMFFIHSFANMESGILLAMAFDRYVAICNPLRYTSIVTINLIVKSGIMLLIRATVLIAPFIFLIKRFSLFKTNVISHSYCEHMAVVKLIEADTRINSAYGLFAAFLGSGFDFILICLSYVMIFRAVFHLPSKKGRLKAFNTCLPHIFSFLIFYTLALFSSLSHRYGKSIPPYIHIILSDLYLLLPPTLNPMVYGVKTKQLRDRALMLLLSQKTVCSTNCH